MTYEERILNSKVAQLECWVTGLAISAEEAEMAVEALARRGIRAAALIGPAGRGREGRVVVFRKEDRQQAWDAWQKYQDQAPSAGRADVLKARDARARLGIA